jgi:hypothetical protein
MPFILSFFQLLCWVAVGYNLALHNTWAQVSFGLAAVVLGLISAMNEVGKEIRKRGTSN